MGLEMRDPGALAGATGAEIDAGRIVDYDEARFSATRFGSSCYTSVRSTADGWFAIIATEGKVLCKTPVYPRRDQAFDAARWGAEKYGIPTLVGDAN